jgi:phage tail protein X
MERSALVLNLESEQRSDWQRQAYETMEDWLARIEQLLFAQHAKIQALREQVQDADQDESNVVERIQRYRKLNEGLQGLVLRSRAQQEQQSLGEEQEPVKEKRAPFTVHMIKRGDTLYSLAKHYYGDAQKVHDIMLWNQGWVRYPEQIKAGQALILYPPGARDTREVVVERYLEEFLKQHSATL